MLNTGCTLESLLLVSKNLSEPIDLVKLNLSNQASFGSLRNIMAAAKVSRKVRYMLELKQLLVFEYAKLLEVEEHIFEVKEEYSYKVGVKGLEKLHVSHLAVKVNYKGELPQA